jgi:eukaryotic-like serine/threonine-protein kinase
MTFNRFVSGSVIADRYTIVDELDCSPGVAVYRCHAPKITSELVVLKVFDRSEVSELSELRRFEKEIRAAFSIQHPNVVHPYEVVSSDTLFGYSMEYVRGGDLADLLGSTAELPFELVIELTTKICDGLGEIHRRGIIHRDIKPENILLTDECVPKIADFGVALVLSGDRSTRKGTVLGTTQYVSPEYLSRDLVDELSDIYSLGVMTFQMICNTYPFQSDTIIGLFDKIKNSPPHKIEDFRPDCPAELVRIVKRAMARERKERFQSVDEMQQELMALLEVNPAPVEQAIEVSRAPVPRAKRLPF